MAGRQFKATNEQLAALEAATDLFKESERRNTKETFIRDFLGLSSRVTHDMSGSSTPVGKGLTLFQYHGASNHIATPTEEAPNLGVELKVYRVVIAKEDYWHKRKPPVGGIAVGAEVQLGLIVAGTFPGLAGQETVLRVTSLPPIVAFKQKDPELVPIEPMTEAWDEMVTFASSLISRESELISKFNK